MNMKIKIFFAASFALAMCACGQKASESNSSYVNRFIGTGGDARVSPVASMPFGMIQMAPDTRNDGSGYHYNDGSIVGFSHVHKSGGGCGDFLDVLFMPLPRDMKILAELSTGAIRSPFSHKKESAGPGYYSVELFNGEVNAELTATLRTGVQRYAYGAGSQPKQFLIDLEHGAAGTCTIEPGGKSRDTVYCAYIEVVDDRTVQGYRLSHGWCPEQHVYFHTTFSSPITGYTIYSDNRPVEGVATAEGQNIKLVLAFDEPEGELVVRSAISPVDMDGARLNLAQEAADKDFDQVRADARAAWDEVLAAIKVETKDKKRKEIFYTSLYNTMLYPMLFSDVDYRFRGPDRQVHQTDGFPYYGGVVGLWDTFRAASPLSAVLHPGVMEDYVNTCLEHYKYAGQLPIWTLAGQETYQMIGIHSLPVITNCYMNRITGFDAQYALEAMVRSADRDTCGWSMGYFVGLENYKKYGYVPCDLEMESVARTLEYAYDDWAVAKFADLLDEGHVYDRFLRRSMNFVNLFDPASGYMRGRTAAGDWRTPFDPFRSEHRRDDYCEGNAWQWTFFVPHRIDELARLVGGEQELALRLDSLFTLDSKITGENVSGDISGMIGQYAHGNEPGHHTVYMYNHVGQPHKAQFYAHKVLTELYDNTPDGICGQEDTGQMSAWYVFSSMGFYPLDPVSGRYEFGSPLFDKVTISMPSGNKFTVIAENLSDDNIYIESAWLNGQLLDRTYITFDELLDGGELKFIMYSGAR